MHPESTDSGDTKKVKETAMMNLFKIVPSTERMALLIVALLAAVSLLCGVFSWAAHKWRRKSRRHQVAMIRNERMHVSHAMHESDS
jgi:uncharacterized membrane protein